MRIVFFIGYALEGRMPKVERGQILKRESTLIGIVVFFVLFVASICGPDGYSGTTGRDLSLIRNAEASAAETESSVSREKDFAEEEEVEENVEEEAPREETSPEESAEADENDAEEAEVETEEKAEPKEEAVQETQPKSLNEELHVIAVEVEGIVDRLHKIQESAKKKEREDLAPGLADLEEKIASFRKQSGLVFELNEAFSDKGNAHFAAWGQELAGLESESLRKKGEKRRSKQLEIFKGFENKMAGIEKELVSFQSSVQEIANYLKYDLKRESIQEISGEIDKIKKTGGNISKQIRDAQKDMENLPVL